MIGIILVIVSLIILLIAVFLFLKKPKAVELISAGELSKLRYEQDQLKILLAKAEEKSNGLVAEKESITNFLKEEKSRLIDELLYERTQLAQANQSLESARAYYKSQQEKLQEQKAEIEQIRTQFQREFENVAEKLLKEKSKEFTDINRSNLDVILNPLKENLKAFEDKVEKVYNMEAAERNTLKGVITQLMDLNKQISDEAQNLTKALKGDNKKQGNWGEVILERVLERSGLVRDQEYRIQAAMQATDGARYQPDVIIDLPDEKHLIIDSKVSLIAYEKLVNADTEEDRKLFAKAHVESIRGHVAGLSAKKYHDLYKINSPDFVLLFVPIESSFSIAVQLDGELFNYAWDRKVVIVSPSTLLATLRTIASMWKQERQNRNVLEIARLSGDMYDKFVGFLSDMDSIGKNINQTQSAYNNAINKLSEGRGNLTTTAEKIKKLGAKADKQIDQKYIGEE
ncbi:DNA recombination protein RmuC [Mucilaginibacter rubeus]|uniref:DNA recombination protein RmuC n=1 Tax=Mucilaginibacter rubeus TaxID=2027860 RepID=A0AAE6JJR3_9SPHI|nr:MULTISPECIES: DNA recombination protein RmuC [Mucilaginibacter]QEM06880.1 DNA recombination protein RmuC [Mucilaginibacter rubeus]QEM19469.1 DNA recombination protein RmuC [Mucilaginibacter gossypii]QTE43982.1 DNA recombination protein RmuC [Mucilaginibacter rubeus]QTE50583.1 DNA recombination protein RmuC [Mucilaginibacter rubeus]QTE55668.1 DNA recombination protein RmuC [Mucilaginibacter rubeus]